MSQCDFCGKKVSFGIKVSHSHRRSNRTWKPNIRKARILVSGSKKRINICSGCIRSGCLENTNYNNCNFKMNGSCCQKKEMSAISASV